MRLVLPFLFVLACVAAIIGMMGGQFALFFDYPSLTVALVFPLIYTLLMFGVNNAKIALFAPLCKDASAEELAIALAYTKTFGKSTWLFSIVGFCLSAMVILADVTNIERLGAFMAVNITLILYAALINLLVVLPHAARIKQRQEER
jgi:flagellar motor component MotA